MGFWKILGGVAIGVGAVAAAPFTGGGSILAGASLAGSLAGAGAIAAVAGTAGGIAGGILSETDKEKERQARNEGKTEAKAEYDIELRKIKERVDRMEKALNGYRSYEEMLLAMHAVACSVAACDGDFSQDEKQEIEEFINGASVKSLPDAIRTQLDQLFKSPPSFNTAMEYVRRIDVKDWSIFDDTIDIVIEADGKKHPKEIDYKSAWKEFYLRNAA